MNKELKMVLSAAVIVSGFKHDRLIFTSCGRHAHIHVAGRSDAKLTRLTIIPFTGKLDASKFSNAVTAWLKQNVLEWSQV